MAVDRGYGEPETKTKPKTKPKTKTKNPPLKKATRAAIKSDMNSLVNKLKSKKYKNMTAKKRDWAQVDNYRVALKTLKEKKRKSISENKTVGTRTYQGGSVKVRTVAGQPRDTGRGGGVRSSTGTNPKPRRPGRPLPGQTGGR
jgi:hypothetical protein